MLRLCTAFAALLTACSFDTRVPIDRATDAGTGFGIDGATPGIDAEPADARPPDAGPADETIESLRVTIDAFHGRCGNLTIKLTSPSGTTMTLLSRPGFIEDADDGSNNGTNVNYDASGDQSNVHIGFPITFRDDQGRDAELMGDPLTGTTTGICEDDAFCDYIPNPAAAGGPTTLTAAFAGQTPLGTWQLCIGDSHADGNTEGQLQAWTIGVTTNQGSHTKSSGSLGLAIADDSYDGSLGSMRCHEIALP